MNLLHHFLANFEKLVENIVISGNCLQFPEIPTKIVSFFPPLFLNNEHTASLGSALRAAQLTAQRSAQLAAQRAVRSPATRRALQQAPAEKAWKRHVRPTKYASYMVFEY